MARLVDKARPAVRVAVRKRNACLTPRTTLAPRERMTCRLGEATLLTVLTQTFMRGKCENDIAKFSHIVERSKIVAQGGQQVCSIIKPLN